jgi:transcriptional regulator of acetoin/glycerol metabolism
MPTAPFAMDLYPPGPPAGSGTPAHPYPVAPTPPAGTPALTQPRPLRELEKEGIIAALNATGGNKAQAAALLEIDRSTLYKKIKDYGIQ